MTKVLILAPAKSLVLAVCLSVGAFCSQSSPAPSGNSDAATSRPAEALYLQLGQVKLDPSRVFQVRGASLDRSAVHISLEDGTIAFTQNVMGRITGAFFEGDGEILLSPPNETERHSMSLFTGMAILEERFATAYFRFNDDTATEMGPDLRTTDQGPEFIAQWNETAQNLAAGAAMRLLVSFSRRLPAQSPDASKVADAGRPDDRMLYARLQGKNLGVFDVFFDSTAPEQVQVGQSRTVNGGTTYYDVWTAFSPTPPAGNPPAVEGQSSPGSSAADDPFTIRRYAIKSEVQPPKYIQAEARLDVELRRNGVRTLLFELSRFLNVDRVEMDGEPVEFIHNPAVEGTQLSRRGNDLVAVVLPAPSVAGQKLTLRFTYGGEVLAEAGSGLLYVGARGTWYPNRGLGMADFDLEFRYPPGWTLVATGKPASPDSIAAPRGEQVGRWISDRPIPIAGFNLGRYRLATAQAGSVTVETYATGGVERSFPNAPPQVLAPIPGQAVDPRRFEVIPPAQPSPARKALPLAEVAASAIQYYSRLFGPYPYSQLELTQMPGPESQGWPGLVFLSSFAFLNANERKQLHFTDRDALLQEQIPAHEVAHQWWGDLVTWKTYRDQWFSEGLAGYCSLMMLQEKNPAGFRLVMDSYRRDLVQKNKDGALPKDAGAVTLGSRLLSSHFPEGYEAVTYGRGAWMFHMLRTMLQDAASNANAGRAEEPFVRGLRKVRERYEGKAITTRQLLDVFAEDLPPSLQYEGKKSLDWFLDGWVNGTAMPKLGVTGVKFMPKGGSTVVTGTIVQKEAPDDLVTSVPIYAMVGAKQPVLLGRIFADGKETAFHLNAPAGAHKILLDPHETILTAP